MSGLGAGVNVLAAGWGASMASVRTNQGYPMLDPVGSSWLHNGHPAFFPRQHSLHVWGQVDMSGAKE